MSPAPRRIFRTATAAAVALSACQSAQTSLPADPPTVRVVMREYAFDYPSSVPAGRVVFRVGNVGRIPHRLVLQPLAEEMPPITQQLRGGERRAAQPFAGIPNQEPGDNTAFAVDLEPGRRYALICFVTDADGQPHALKGMASEFRAAGGPRPGSSPAGAVPSSSVPPGGRSGG